MLTRELVIGHRIADIVGDASLSDDDFNFTDFIYILDNEIAIRMPYDDESGDLLPQAIVTPKHKQLAWPQDDLNQFKHNLRDATIADIQIPQARDERYPDAGTIKLSSGWYVRQLSGAPRGIAPSVYIQKEPGTSDVMVSIWATMTVRQVP